MNRMWEFFEQLDEMVYVTNIETHELVYMNQHLRQALGYENQEAYLGKLCHQVLQGLDAPCVFCTDDQLREGEFVSWTHKNPVLNKRFLVKDTVVTIDGKRYRIEIAIDADSETACKSPYYYARSETILNDCLQLAFSSACEEDALEAMLAYLGRTFSCDRAYIFEIDNDTGITNNTYEWCAQGVAPQKELLQGVPLSAIDWWLTLFARNEVTLIPDLEKIRDRYPESYAILKPQNIHSLAAGPIKAEGQIVGFLGVDNPTEQMMTLIEPLLNVIGYFVASLLRRRDLLARLHELSYHDQLTGAYNRHALAEYYGTLDMDCVGVIYCDITGLKQVNDDLGHEAGDRMICSCYETLQAAVDSGTIYRTGGDEFVVLCPNCTEEAFQDILFRLRRQNRQSEYHMALGHAWSDAQPLVLEKLIAQADKLMYQDKRRYYAENGHRPGIERRRGQEDREEQELTPFQRFLQTGYCDVETLFQSSSRDNDSSYFYLGDMQKDLFYVSDNMRDDFGFQSNLVPNLLQKWSRRISTPEFQDLFWQDISGMLREKRTYHDLRYRVRDVNGNNQWIRCYGILKWNEDKTKPLFFSGRVTHQDKNFVVDPISNFPREQAFFRQMNELAQNGEQTVVIGFCLNGVSEVNSTKGRAYGDRLLKKLADALMEALSWKMYFYRTDGMRCLAVVNPLCRTESSESLVEQIREIAKGCYESMGISLQHVCSFAVMDYPCPGLSPEDLLDTMISLIRLARQESKLNYVDYSDQNIQRMKRMSNMVLALGQDVSHNMENFRIVVQPVVSAGDGHMCGGEVLLRWTFEGQNVSPAAFIPVLEKEGLIQEVGRWVFEQAVCTCVRLHAYDPTFYLTFNVSFHQLSDAKLVDFMEQTLEKYHLEGSSLVAELTENSLDEEPEKLMEFVDACQRLGIYTALDDFGSGYSSMRMLLQYPSSIIKLDRSLVQEAMESQEKMDFIRSIVFACHQFGKAVCVEGVEDAAQNEIIIATGCDMIQGYYYHRPMELSDLYRLVSQNSKVKKGGA